MVPTEALTGFNLVGATQKFPAFMKTIVVVCHRHRGQMPEWTLFLFKTKRISVLDGYTGLNRNEK